MYSGSQALFYFHWGEFAMDTMNLDLYTPEETAEDVVNYLIEHEGYSLCRHPVVDPTQINARRMEGSVRIIRLKKHDKNIHVTQSSTALATHPLTSSWSTLLMNYVGPNECVSMYPALMFKGQGLLTPYRAGEGHNINVEVQAKVWREIGELRQKYDQRGFVHWGTHEMYVHDSRMVEGGLCEAQRSACCPSTVRRVGDRWCAVVPLTAAGVGETVEIDDGTPILAWMLGGKEVEEPSEDEDPDELIEIQYSFNCQTQSQVEYCHFST